MPTQDRTSSLSNSKLCKVAAKKIGLNRSPCQHRTLCLVLPKKTTRSRSSSPTGNAVHYIEKEIKNRCLSEHWALHCYVETSKVVPLPQTNKELCIATSQKAKPSRLCPKGELYLVTTSIWLPRKTQLNRPSRLFRKYIKR